MLAIGAEHYGTGQMSSRGQIYDFLAFAGAVGGLRVEVKSHDALHCPHVHVVVMKSDPKGARQSARKDFAFLCSTSMLWIAENVDSARPGFRQKNIAVGRYLQPARRFEVRGIHVHAESPWHRRKKSPASLPPFLPLSPPSPRQLRGKLCLL